MAAAEDIRTVAAVEALLSELDGVFLIKRGTKNSTFHFSLDSMLFVLYSGFGKSLAKDSVCKI